MRKEECGKRNVEIGMKLNYCPKDKRSDNFLNINKLREYKA